MRVNNHQATSQNSYMQNQQMAGGDGQQQRQANTAGGHGHRSRSGGDQTGKSTHPLWFAATSNNGKINYYFHIELQQKLKSMVT